MSQANGNGGATGAPAQGVQGVGTQRRRGIALVAQETVPNASRRRSRAQTVEQKVDRALKDTFKDMNSWQTDGVTIGGLTLRQRIIQDFGLPERERPPLRQVPGRHRTLRGIVPGCRGAGAPKLLLILII